MMMQDRFKFRVWDTIGNCYCPRSHYILLSDGTLIEEIGGEDVICDSENIEFCTGLKDKNDKLIYEGDIVKDEHDRKYIVKFGKHTVTIPVGYVNGETECLGWYLDNGYLSYHLNPDDDYLIIGNIHENEDLLENE